ncbi:MAG: DUF86 domain-containing protein, partial [Planctomycetaceae bacterium]|nr:DUF86 domain-containing protein [Planctomycetaceae bacterium]
FIGSEDLLLMIERCFTIAGEAAVKMPEYARQKFPQIPWREMSDFRNVVVHEYGSIDYRKMWTIIQNDIPEVLAKLEKIAVSEHIPLDAAGHQAAARHTGTERTEQK